MTTRAQHVLVLEDSILVAMAVEEDLIERGHRVTVCGTLAEAERALRSGPVDAALLDLHVQDGNASPLALQLVAQGVPVALVSGIDPGLLPPPLAALPLFAKPVAGHVLADWVDTRLVRSG